VLRRSSQTRRSAQRLPSSSKTLSTGRAEATATDFVLHALKNRVERYGKSIGPLDVVRDRPDQTPAAPGFEQRLYGLRRPLTVLPAPPRVLFTESRVLSTVPPTESTVLLTVSLTPSVPGVLMVGELDEPPPEPPEPLSVEALEPLPDPPVPTTVPFRVEPPPVPRVVDLASGFDPTGELLASLSTARFSPLGSVWAEGKMVSEPPEGPLVTAARPEVMPERPVPKAIKPATATGTAHITAPANPDDAIQRRHHASSPLLM